MARPKMTTKTERSIYKRLHEAPDQFRSEWHIAERNTKHARAVITRWISEGILESKIETPHPNSSYKKVGYRLAEQWRDESVVDENLLERQEQLDAEASQTRENLMRARDALRDSWQQSRRLIGAEDVPEDALLQEALQEALHLVNALRRTHSLARTDRLLTERRAAVDAQVSERHLQRMDDAAPDADPLGGDA